MADINPLYQAVERAKKAGVLHYIPDLHYMVQYTRFFEKAVDDHLVALNSKIDTLISQRKQIQQSSPDFFKFGGFTADVYYSPQESMMTDWLAKLEQQYHIINTVKASGVALYSRAEGPLNMLMAVDAKGRNWTLAALQRDQQTTGPLVELNTNTPPQNLPTTYQSFAIKNVINPNKQNLSLISGEKLPFFMFNPGDALAQNRDAIQEYLSAQLKNDTGTLCLPMQFSSPEINTAFSRALNSPLPELISKLKAGPTSRTLMNLITDSLKLDSSTTPKLFISNLASALNEKGLSNPYAHFPDEQVNAIVDPRTFEFVRVNGGNHMLLDRVLRHIDIPQTPSRKPKQDNAPGVKPQQEHAKVHQEKAGKQEPTKTQSAWWEMFNEAKEKFQQCKSVLEASQLTNALVRTVAGDQSLSLTAPEKSSLEHIVTAMQFQSDDRDVEGGLRWFIKVVESAIARRQMALSTNAPLENKNESTGRENRHAPRPSRNR